VEVRRREVDLLSPLFVFPWFPGTHSPGDRPKAAQFYTSVLAIQGDLYASSKVRVTQTFLRARAQKVAAPTNACHLVVPGPPFSPRWEPTHRYFALGRVTRPVR
jgi:hypothetical protein